MFIVCSNVKTYFIAFAGACEIHGGYLVERVPLTFIRRVIAGLDPIGAKDSSNVK
jgi:hypothetical protein